jgi:Na+/melibiose symporter-like transporter
MLRTVFSWAAALLLSLLLLPLAVGIGGAGHGWVAGAMGCLFLMPVSLIALANAFNRQRSTTIAKRTLYFGLGICVYTVIATLISEKVYFLRFARNNDLWSFLILLVICSQWLVASLFVLKSTNEDY